MSFKILVAKVSRMDTFNEFYGRSVIKRHDKNRNTITKKGTWDCTMCNENIVLTSAVLLGWSRKTVQEQRRWCLVERSFTYYSWTWHLSSFHV